MAELKTENLLEFLEYYHDLHDSFITNIEYDIHKAQIQLLINVYWSGEPKLKTDNTYETNKKKMKMIFEGIEQVNIKEFFSWDYIHEAYIKSIKLNNKEFLCFADEEEEPLLYIVCETIRYDEL
jgi:hypothetical protein